MLDGKDTNNILRNYCLGFCVLLVIAMCDGISIGLRQEKTSTKGSRVDIICDIGNAYEIVFFYRFDTSGSKTGFTTCGKNSCIQSTGYNITQTEKMIIVTILDLQRHKDEKWWECIAGDGANSSFYLTVYTAPTGVMFSSSKACDLAKESCSFTCQTSSCTYPDPVFLWYFTATDGSTQPVFGNVVRSNDSSSNNCDDKERKYSGQLFIPMNTTFQRNQAKTVALECRIRFYTLANQLKSQSPDPVQFAVAVKEVHLLPESGASINIIEGMSKPISCITSGSRPASAVTWFKEKIGQTKKQLGAGNESFVSEENDLTVTNSTLMLRTTKADQGWRLSCEAVSFGTKKVSASNPKGLNILYPTSITVFIASKSGESPATGTVTVKEHDGVSGQCEVDSNPASSIEVVQRETTFAKASNSKELTFQISNASCSNNGVILCKGWNDVPSSTIATKSLQLNVECSPRQEHDTDPVVVARQGKQAVMSLSIFAYPAPTSHAWHHLIDGQWKLVRNNTNFLLTYSYLQYNLTVMNVTRQLYGNYNLTLANGIGSPLTFTFSLQNKGKPEEPTDISVAVLSPTAITVTWTAGYDGEVKQQFHVQYKSSNAHDWNTVEVADPKSDARLFVEINDLQPSADYMLRVFSANAVGNSSLSETLTFRMKDPESSSLGAIIGGVVGGIVAVCLITVGIFCICRRNLLPKEAESKGKAQQPVDDCSYAVVNKTPGQISLETKRPLTNAENEQAGENYVNQGFTGDKMNSKTTKKNKPAKPGKKQQTPKNLSHDGLQYADLSFDDNGKSEKRQKPKKLKPPEGVIYDAVQIGVVGDAYYIPQNEKSGSE